MSEYQRGENLCLVSKDLGFRLAHRDLNLGLLLVTMN